MKKYDGKINVLETEVLWQIMQWDTKLKNEARKTGKFLSGCGAGFSGLSVLSDGTVYPCRRLPIPIGHISEGIRNIMLENKVLQDLRDFDKCMKVIGDFSKKVYPKLKGFIDALFEEGIIKNDIAYRAGFDFIRKGDNIIISHPTCTKGKESEKIDNDLPPMWSLSTTPSIDRRR